MESLSLLMRREDICRMLTLNPGMACRHGVLSKTISSVVWAGLHWPSRNRIDAGTFMVATRRDI